MESFEDSFSKSRTESKDDEKLPFSHLPSEEPGKKIKAVGQTLFLLKDDFNISLSQDESKTDTEKGPYSQNDLKLESLAVNYNLKTDDTRLFNDHHMGIENCYELKNTKLSAVDSTDESTPEEFHSIIVSQDRKSSSIKTPMVNVSEKMTPLLSLESKFSFTSDVTSQSASSNVPSIPTGTDMVPSMTSGPETPIPEGTKTSTKFYLYEYPNRGIDNDSEVFNNSHSQTTLEKSSNNDSSSKTRAASSRSTRSPLMKDLSDPESGGRQSSFNSSPIWGITRKLPNSIRERNNTSKLQHKSSPERKSLKRTRKPYEFLTTGTPLLKFCSRKPPHWRHFEVNTDLEYLIWYADKKSIKQTRIALIDIEDVLLGQVTPGFSKCPRSQLFHQSFSIKYKRKKYLDLICLTHRDCQMWYYSLRHLLQNIRDGDKWRWINDIQIPRQNEKSKNAIYPAREGKTWVKYIEYLERSQYQIRELLKQSEELLNFSDVSFMRKRLKEQIKQVDRWAEDAETSEYLLMTQYDELRAIRVEIRVLQYKVAALLKEKTSKGGHLFNIFRFGSFSSSAKSSFSNKAIPLSKGQHSFNSSQPTYSTPHSQGRGSRGKIEALSTVPMRWESIRSERRSLISPKWYRRMPREKKSLVRKIMVNDIINGTLSEETVTRVCSIFRVSRDEVEAMAKYLDEKYTLKNITKSRTV